ncbi:MAG: 3-isopropylmalate dehydratase small subunit, partial [Rhodospirillales bacterium]
PDKVKTDKIITIQRYLLSDRKDMHEFAFETLRFLEDGSDNPEFILNKPAYEGAQILISGNNFGCGSSRESAVWALNGLGLQCIIAPSFGNIFYNNCFQNGMLPIVLDQKIVEKLAEISENSGNNAPFSIDLEAQTVTAPNGEAYSFEIEPQRRHQLLEGLDDIGVTLTKVAEIKSFRKVDEKNRPWIYN